MVKGSCFVYVVWKSYYRDNISSVEFVKAIKLFIMSLSVVYAVYLCSFIL